MPPKKMKKCPKAVVALFALVMATATVSKVEGRVTKIGGQDSGLSPAETAAEESAIRSRPPWAVRQNTDSRREVQNQDPRPISSRSLDISSTDSVDRRHHGPFAGDRGRARGHSSASMFVRSTYNPSRRSISFPESSGQRQVSPRADPFLTTMATPAIREENSAPKRKRVKLIRFIDNEGNVEKSEAQTISPAFNNDIRTTAAPAPTDPAGLEEVAGESSKSSSGSSNSLLDIGKPGNPYELIQVAFPQNSRIKPHTVSHNELLENDLTDFDPNEIYFTDGNLLVLRGGNFPKNYRPADPGPPIDNFRAPYREPKLPPAGLEFGGSPLEGPPPPEFYPENPPPGKDLFGNPIDPHAQPNATEYNLCPIGGPCQPLLFPPLVGEHPPPDGIAPIILLHPDVKVSKLKEKPQKSVYPPDADRYTYYAINYGRPRIVPSNDALEGVDKTLKQILKGFFPPVNSQLPESIGTPVLSNVPKVPLAPVSGAKGTPRPPIATAFPPQPPRPTKPPKKIFFPTDEMFEFPELVTKVPKGGKFPTGSKPVFFPSNDKRPPTKYELYQQLLREGRAEGKVSPWVPRLSRKPDGSISIDPSDSRGGPNPNYQQSQLSAGSINGLLQQQGNFRRPHSNQQFHLQQAFSEDFGTTFFPSSTPPPPPASGPGTTISLEHDIDVNYKKPLPPINVNSENFRPRFREPLSPFPVTTTASPFAAPIVASASPFSASNLAPNPSLSHLAVINPGYEQQVQLQQQQLLRQLQREQQQQQQQHQLALQRQQRDQLQQQSKAAFVRYLFQLGPPSTRPLIQYTQFLGRRKRM